MQTALFQVILALPLAACFTALESDSAELADDLVEPPRPFVDLDWRTAIEPGFELRLYHSWHGYCETLWEYPCEFRSYDVEVSCSKACELVDFVALGDGRGDAFGVVPLELGEQTITLTLRGPTTVRESMRIEVLEPTGIEIECIRGRLYPADNRESCTGDFLLPPWDGKDLRTQIYLQPAVLSGGVEIQGLLDRVERSWPGGEGRLDPPDALPAAITATASYRELETSVTKWVLPATTSAHSDALR